MRVSVWTTDGTQARIGSLLAFFYQQWMKPTLLDKQSAQYLTIIIARVWLSIFYLGSYLNNLIDTFTNICHESGNGELFQWNKFMLVSYLFICVYKSCNSVEITIQKKSATSDFYPQIIFCRENFIGKKKFCALVRLKPMHGFQQKKPTNDKILIESNSTYNSRYVNLIQNKREGIADLTLYLKDCCTLTPGYQFSFFHQNCKIMMWKSNNESNIITVWYRQQVTKKLHLMKCARCNRNGFCKRWNMYDQKL